MEILVGYAGTGAAEEALTLAKEHAKAFNAKINRVTSLEG